VIPHEHLDPGICLPPQGHGGGLPVVEQREAAPLFEITHKRVVGVALPPHKIIPAELRAVGMAGRKGGG
jgi:hypothetical protein